MKNLVKQICKQTTKAFTLIEMLVVLLIISILMLLFVPNLSNQKEAISEKGNAAVVKVVESQAELYELEGNGPATLTALKNKGMISEKQAETYQEYTASHGGGNIAN